MTEKQLAKEKMKKRTTVIKKFKQISRQKTESGIYNYSIYINLHA